MADILIIDDEKVLAESLGILFRDEGHQVRIASSVKAGLQDLDKHEPDIILLDLRLPDGSGMEVLRRSAQLETAPQVIMMTAFGDTASVVEAIKLGAFNYLNKPFELQEILFLVGKAVEQRHLRDEIHFLRDRQRPAGALDEMVGESAAMREVAERIRLVARAGDASVLITGESGTGKELVASALHQLGPGQEAPYVEVNCAALPENLLESELFGYEKGAFTDARGRKRGLFELAHTGTIFLDEIGEMPLVLQAKLLRFLEKRSFRRLGGTEDLRIQARVVAATNRDLREAVRSGTFREDLYYRLNVIPIHLPTLRERPRDIPLLVAHFLQRFCRELRCPVREFHPEVARLLQIYTWPGNIRELKNIVERLVILCPGNRTITPDLLPEEIRTAGAGAAAQPHPGDNLDAQLDHIERELIEDALNACGQSRTQAADRLGISRHSLKRRMKRLGLLTGEDDDEP